MMQLVLFLATLLSSATAEPRVEARVEVWAGHEVLNGKRKIPLYGEKETHTENYVIAEVHRTPSRIDIYQRLCRIDIRPIKGVTPTMKPETVLHLPKAHIVLDEKADGSLSAAPWTTGWANEDIDADGSPGATVQISGTSCSGDIFVSSQTTTALLGGHASDDGASGTISVRLKQKILGAHGLCLKLMAGDSDETQTGSFVYRRVAPGTTCTSLAGKPWPTPPPMPAK
jgi:hypothetical protein